MMVFQSGSARFIGTTIAYIVILIVLPELALRTPQAVELLGPGSIRTGYAQLDVKAVDIANYERHYGSMNCLIIGASDAMAAINPDGIDGYNCYNFSLGGLQIDEATSVLEVLMVKYDFDLVIIGSSPYLFTPKGSDRILINNAHWLCCYGGKFDMAGWLGHNSSSYQYYELGMTWLLNFGFYTDRQEFAEEISDTGYRARSGSTPSSDPEFEGKLKTMRERTNYIIASMEGGSVPDMAYIQRMAEWQAGGTRFVFTDMLIRPETFSYYPEVQQGYDLFNEQVKPVLLQYNFTHLDPRGKLVLPDNYWQDIVHMNVDGAAAYTGWLNEQLIALDSH